MTTATEAPELEFAGEVLRTHYSALSAYRSCASRWHYRYVLRIKQPDIGPRPEAHFGSWWGALTAAEGLERGRRLGSLKAEPGKLRGPDDSPEFDQRDVRPDDIFDAAEVWWRQRDLETQAMWLERLGAPLPHRLRALYESWMDEWAGERQHELPLGYEVRWTRELPRPKDDAAWSLAAAQGLGGVDLLGYIDEVYFDAQRGIVVVRDRKSHKVLRPASALDDMMDSQLQLYAWGGSPLIQEWGHGAPRAVAYDRARSVEPKKPEVTKTAGTLSKGVTDYDLATYLRWARTDTRPLAEIAEWLDARSFAQDENGEDVYPTITDTPEDYIHYVQSLPPGPFWGEFGAFVLSGANKGKPKFGVYQEEPAVVEKLSTPAARSIWFQRTRVPVNRHVVIAHLRAALDTATDAWETVRRVEATGDAPRSLGQACTWCDYQTLCRARLMGGADGEYDLAEHGLEAPDGARYLINGRLEKELS